VFEEINKINLMEKEGPRCREDNYEFIRLLGEGSFGQVFLAREMC
jgi:serine/threonine protein kinase